MNNNQRSDLDFSTAELDQFSNSTLLDVMPEKIDEGVATKFVLIKHDYYSTDSDHGRDILSGFLTSLTDSSYSSIVIYLIDKGVKLLDEENPLYDKMLRLLEKSETVIAAEESFDEYNVSYPVTQKISIESIMSVTEDITYLDNLLTLE